MPLNEFVRSEDGAVTVDWVVLTASLVGLGLAVTAVIASGTNTTLTQIDAYLNSPSVITRIQSGFGYEAYDSASYNALLLSASSLSDADLAQIAAYGNAIGAQVTADTDPAIAGQVADFNKAIDIAYASAGTTRPTGTDFDEAELTRISTDLGYDPLAYAGG